MTDAAVSFAGNLTDDPDLRHTVGGIERATFRVAISGLLLAVVAFGLTLVFHVICAVVGWVF
jgi:single-stranded DNA-binding protein